MPPRPVDRAWLNGLVFTGTAFAEALLVEGGRVVVAGTRDAVLRAKGTGTEVENLHGRLVVPGLIDLHMHLVDTTLLREGADLHGVRSLAELAARVGASLGGPGAEPVFGYGWDQENLAERRYPTRDDLDRISSDRPLVLFRVCSHVAVVNSAALDRLGLDDRSPNPPGGELGRDGAGRLNGLLFEEALGGVWPLLARRAAAVEPAVVRTLDYAASVGLTTVASVLAKPEEVRAVAAWPADRFATRVRFYLDLKQADAAPGLPPAPADGRWRLTGTKAILDGALGARTAWLDDPYSDAPGSTGYPLWTEERLTAALAVARTHGLPPALHAIGDRAIRWALDLLARSGAAGTPRIEHASVTPPAVVAELQRLRPAVVVQPHFVATDWWVAERLGPERARGTYAFRTLLDAGLVVGGSSDSPVEPLDPWTGLRAAVHRAAASAFGRRTADQRLAPIEALQLYTRNAGVILGEPELGRLAAGGPADLLVLSVPSLDAAVGSARPPVAETWVGGVRRFPSASA